MGRRRGITFVWGFSAIIIGISPSKGAFSVLQLRSTIYCISVFLTQFGLWHGVYLTSMPGGGWGCKMRGVHLHESRCLRGHQLRLLSIPSTLNCVLCPATRHDASNPTLHIILRASLAAAIFNQLLKLFNTFNNCKRVPVTRPVLRSASPHRLQSRLTRNRQGPARLSSASRQRRR